MKLKIPTFLAAAATVALLAAFPAAPPASAGVSFGIRVGVPAPPLRHEVVVARPGPGYVYVPGYWDWAPARHEYVWVGGAWARPPHRHAVWVAPRWRGHGRNTFYVRGHWRH
jgi:WXXGXW repeat (2 copies)